MELWPIMSAMAHDGAYVLVALAVVLPLGWWVMDTVMTPGTDLRVELFEKDNPVAGFEFAGMLAILLYLAYNATTGPADPSFLQDLAVTAGFTAGSLLLFTACRAVLNRIVRSHNGEQDLNHEIYEQKNWAAACCSLACMIGLANGITEEDFLGATPLRDAALAVFVAAVGLGAVWIYRFTHLRGRSFLDMLFTKDNPAAGVSLLGFAFAANIVTFEVVKAVKTTPYGTLASVGLAAVLSLVCIAGVAVLRSAVLWFLHRKLGVSITSEVVEQSNVGAGFIDAGVTIGVTLVLTGGLI